MTGESTASVAAPVERTDAAGLSGGHRQRRGSERPFALRYVALLALVVFVIGLFGTPYILTVASQAAVIAVVVFGLVVLTGYTGQISFGQTVFFGIGAYTAALANTELGWPPILDLVAAIVVALVAAVLVGWPVLRLRGHFLTLATFSLALIFYAWVSVSPLTHGFVGIGGIGSFSFLGLHAESPYVRFWIVGAIMVLALAACYQLRSGRFGRALLSLSNDEATALSVGIDTGRYRLAAILFSSVFAAVGGWMYAHAVQFVSPETFSFNMVLTLFMVLFLGGTKSPLGVLLAAIVVVGVPETFPEHLQAWQPTIFSAVLILVLVVAPAGFSLRSRSGRRTSVRQEKTR